MQIARQADARILESDLNDLPSANAWMSGVCGPHLLNASNPRSLRFHHRARKLQTLSTTLGIIEYGTDVNIAIAKPEDFKSYSLSLPIVGEQELRKQGLTLNSKPGQAIIVSPNELQELSISGDCRKLQVVIRLSSMQAVLENLLQRKVSDSVNFSAHMDATNGHTASWWRMAEHMIRENDFGDANLHPHISSDLENALIKSLIISQPNNYSADVSLALSTKVPHYLMLAKKFIHDNARSGICVADIEAASGVSRYKLFDEFRRYFDCSPMMYLKKHRLLAVRQEILENSSLRNISAIAMDWGFSHLGRFSCDYRRLFDETPSTTLISRRTSVMR